LNALFFFSSPVIQNNSLAFTAFSNPFYQLVSDGQDSPMDKPVITKKPETELAAAKKIAPATVHATHPRKKNEPYVEVNVVPEEHLVYTTPPSQSEFVQVDERMRLEPRLKKYQEDQVKGTVEATRKVLEAGQWKQVEKNVADALTQTEKENLKEKYYTELDKVDWKKLEDKLRLSYNSINWDRVNCQLGAAISTIKLDSLTDVYAVTLDGLAKAESWMTENKCRSIPDTDLKLCEVKAQKQKVQELLKTIQAIRDKKIIHL